MNPVTPARPRLLIVDDDPLSIRLLDNMLRGEFDISVALNGEQAFKRVLAILPDLVVLDVQMNGMDGYEICRRLKNDELTRDIPIVFVTGKCDVAEEIRGLELGAMDYITKPFDARIVQIRLRNHLELKRQRDLLNRLSSLDGLTGIANRRFFDKFLAQEWGRTVRSEEEISLAMIDVDHFKNFNDHYGHIQGDDCLKAISRALAEALPRATDLVARFGGEEFACVLSNTGSEGALTVAEKLRSTVLTLGIPHSRSETCEVVTISIGVASAKPTKDELTPQDLLRTADRQLYLAKNAGRNQIKLARCSTTPGMANDRE